MVRGEQGGGRVERGWGRGGGQGGYAGSGWGEKLGADLDEILSLLLRVKQPRRR